MRRLLSFGPLLLAASLFAAAVPEAATQTQPGQDRLTVERYLDWEQVADPQISPDGRQVVYTRRWVNKLKDRWDSSLWIMDADGSRHRFLVDGSNPRWSPDGTRILYLAEGQPSGPQIFVRWMDAEGATSQVTRVLESPGNPMWAPDGRSIAFTMLAPPEQRETLTIDMPAAPAGAEWTAAPRIVNDMHYRADRRGFVKPGYQHIWMVPADGGTARQVTKGDWHAGARFVGIESGVGMDWTPDSRTIVFDGLMADDADMRYAESAIYAVEVESGRVRQVTAERGFWSGPTVSPDGRTVAFTGHAYTIQTYHTNDLHAIGIDGSNMRALAPALDRPIGALRWAADSSRVYFTVDDRGSRNIHAATLAGDVRQVTEGVHMLSLSSIARNGTAVGILSAPQEPGDVVRIDLAKPGQPAWLTRVNDDVLAGVRLGAVEELWYEAPDGTRVQGWVVKPPDFNSSRRYPMIMEIHGGPHAMYNVGFSYMYQNFAAHGYVVLYTNPRGSTGYGTDFGNAIDDGYPSVDYDDLVAGVDALVAKGYVDTDRMFVGGCSGGGVLSSWVIGHTDRFAAAAVRCPVTNWISFAGTADIALWGYHRFRARPWDDPAKWLHHSPLMHAPKVKTPTILMTGELDLRTPMAQSEEYFQALKILGVPVTLVRFNEEYHGTSTKPSNFIRTQLYMMKWYERWGGENRWRPEPTSRE
jgi:dipeptidyl aminopeptidase/acylaminoacyl peptidase